MTAPRLRWLLTLALFLVPSRARASDPIAAQALFDQAKQLMAEGRYTAACPKFEESQQADAGLGTQFHLADCWQHVGRTASAWALFRDIEAQARVRGEASRERVAHDRAAALEPLLPKLVIVPHAAETIPGLSIRRDGAEVGREQWGIPVPIDAGTHAVAITAPGKQPWGTGVEVPMDGRTITIDVPPLSNVPTAPLVALAPVAPPLRPAAPAASTAPTGVTSMMPEGPVETSVVENRGGTQRAFGWFFVGAGVVGLASGAYFGSQWANYRNQSDSHCVGDACDAAGRQLRDNATAQGRGAIIAGGSGVISLIFGAVLAATAPGPRIVSSQTARVQVLPVVEPHRGGLSLQGAW